MHPRWTGGVVPPVAAAAAAPRLCLRIGGEDLRDDPVQIVKEGRPLPQDAAAMIPDGCEDEHWEPQSQPRSRGGNTSYVYGSLLLSLKRYLLPITLRSTYDNLTVF